MSTINIKDAPYNAKGDGTTDDTAALTAFFAALGPNRKGVIPAGIYPFTTTINTSASNFTLEGSGSGSTKLLYVGTNTTRDLITFGNNNVFVINATLRGFSIDSNTQMSGGTALLMYRFARSRVQDLVASGQDGTSNLYNGFWFREVDAVYCLGYEVKCKNDGIRVNGGLGTGAKADLHLISGKVLFCNVGIRIGGAFGGLLCDFATVIANNINLIVDTTLASEANRELAFGPMAQFDSAQNGPNVLIQDRLASVGSYFQFDGSWIATSTNHGVIVENNVNATLTFTGGTIFNATGSGIYNKSASSSIHVSGTLIRNNSRYGIESTVFNESISVSGPRFQSNTLGRFGPAVGPVMDYPSSARFGGTSAANVPSNVATGRVEGAIFYITNGRKINEAAGNGTGQLCYFSNGVWRKIRDDAGVEI